MTGYDLFSGEGEGMAACANLSTEAAAVLGRHEADQGRTVKIMSRAEPDKVAGLFDGNGWTLDDEALQAALRAL